MFKYYKVHFILIIISIFLVSCAEMDSQVVPSSKKPSINLPKWYYKDVKFTNKLYGVGIGKSMSIAIDNAILDCLSKVSVTIKTETIDRVSTSKKNDNTRIDEIFISNIVQEIKKTFTSEYYIQKFQKVDNYIVVQISLNKKELIDNIILNIISEENNLKSFKLEEIKNKNILYRITKISNALDISRRIDALIIMLDSLGEKYKQNEKTLEYSRLLKAEYKNLKVYFANNMNSEIYDDMQMKVSVNFKKNIKPILLKQGTKVDMNKNNILFNFSNCAEGYTAIRGNRKFWQSGRVKVYKGCNKLTIIDDKKNELYSKRVAGIKIKDYETIAKASSESYYSDNSQKGLMNMLNDLYQHKEIKYLFGGE